VLYRQPLALLGEPRNRRLRNIVRGDWMNSAAPAVVRGGQIKILQGKIGLEPPRRRLEGLPRDAEALRRRPKPGKPLRKGRIGSCERRCGAASQPAKQKARRNFADQRLGIECLSREFLIFDPVGISDATPSRRFLSTS